MKCLWDPCCISENCTLINSVCLKLYTIYTVGENKHLASLAFPNSHNLTALLGHKVLSLFY